MQKNLVLEGQFLISLDYGNLDAADIAGSTSRRYHKRPCLKYPSSHGHQCQCWLHLLGSKEDLNASQEMWVSHLGLLNTEQKRRLKACISWEQHRRDCSSTPQTTDNSFSCLTRSCSDLGSSCPCSPSWLWSYFTKLKFCFYKPWVYSFLAINLTVTGAIVFPL